LLPFIDRGNEWRDVPAAYKSDPVPFHDPPHINLSRVISIYTCPADWRTKSEATVSDIIVAFTGFVGVSGTNQFAYNGVLFHGSSVRIAEITDGAANTLMVGERPPSADLWYGWWYAGHGQYQDGSADMILGSNEQITSPDFNKCLFVPITYRAGTVTNQCDALHYWSLHSGGANFLFCDGSVRLLAYSAAPIMPALATRAGGEAVTDW
jgi:prepilin-type processing-associated H-X9-DG protein